MSGLTKLFDYQGNKVTFKSENGVTYVNATQMAKAFGKLPKDYLKSQQACELIAAISKRTNILLVDLVEVVKGGNVAGTWLHEDIAIDFAQWLSIDFRLWCNDRIKELLTTGVATIDRPKSEDALLLEAMTILQGRVAQKEIELEQANNTISIQAPKVAYVNQVLASESCHNTTTVAKELGYSAEALNKLLKQRKIQFWQDNHWVLYANYQNDGFAKTRTHNYYDSEGRPKTRVTTVWTEKGREFIHKIVKGGSNPQVN